MYHYLLIVNEFARVKSIAGTDEKCIHEGGPDSTGYNAK